MANKKIGILTSGGDCGGLNAAIRSIFYRAKNKYNMDVFGIKDGTAGFMQRPVAAVELNHKTAPSPTNEELVDAIEVWKIYKLLQRMKNK